MRPVRAGPIQPCLPSAVVDRPLAAAALALLTSCASPAPELVRDEDEAVEQAVERFAANPIDGVLATLPNTRARATAQMQRELAYQAVADASYELELGDCLCRPWDEVMQRRSFLGRLEETPTIADERAADSAAVRALATCWKVCPAREVPAWFPAWLRFPASTAWECVRPVVVFMVLPLLAFMVGWGVVFYLLLNKADLLTEAGRNGRAWAWAGMVWWYVLGMPVFGGVFFVVGVNWTGTLGGGVTVLVIAVFLVWGIANDPELPK